MSGGATSRHSLLINPRGLFVWGYNYYGQLGLGDTSNRTAPQKLKFKTPILAISCGYNHSMILDKRGNVWTWGNNVNGELGVGDTTHRTTPQKVDLTCVGALVVTVACGANHSMILDENGEVWCWGYNEQGQLGLGDTTNRSNPQRLPIDAVITAIACGGCHSVLLDKHGDIWVFGFNGNGELGLGDTDNRNTPQKLNLGNIISSIACGYNHTLALNTQGKVWIWGYNDYGQLGLGDTNRRLLPKDLDFDVSIVTLGGGGLYTMFLDQNGDLWSCGHNGNGELGLGDTRNRSSPVRLDRISGVSSLACYYNHTLAITNKNDIWVWGKNDTGQLGIGDPYPLHTSPRKLEIKGYLPAKQKVMKFSFRFPPRTQASFPDLIVKTEDGQTFYLHKAVFSIRCPKFLKLESGVVDCSSSIFNLFVHYVYENILPETNFTILDIGDLLVFSKRHGQLELVSSCQNFIIKTLSKDNVVQLMTQIYPHANEMSLELDWMIAFCAKKRILPPFKSLKTFSDDFGTKLLTEFDTPTFEWPPIFKPTNTSQSIPAALQVLWKTRPHYDFKILVGKSTFEVHKSVLNQWEYFKILLMKASGKSEVIHTTNMPETTFCKLLGYLYTGSPEGLGMDVGDCAWIISHADYYLLQNQKRLLSFCHEIIDEKFGPENWFEFLKIGIELENEEIQNKALEVSPSFINRSSLLESCKKILSGQLNPENWLDFLQIGVESRNTELQEKALSVAPASVDSKIKGFIHEHLTRYFQQEQKIKDLENANEALQQKLQDVQDAKAPTDNPSFSSDSQSSENEQ